MSMPNQEKISTFIKRFDVLYLSTTINGLPSISCLPYTISVDKSGFELLHFDVTKQSIEYNQLLFNKNCCVVIGQSPEQLKIYGKAISIAQEEKNKLSAPENESSVSLSVIPDTIILEKDNKKTILFERPLKVTKKVIKSNIASESKFWFQISRAPFFTATIMPILLGITLAWVLNDSFTLGFGILTIIAGIGIHAGTNLINDFFDQRTDNLNENFNPFSGGSRTIQLRLATQEKILFSAIVSFAIGVVLVLYMALVIQSVALFVILFIGMFLAYFYTAGPIKLSHHGLGEISNFLGYGPILTIAAWLIQINGNYMTDDLLAVAYWSIVPGLLLTLILLINEFQDFDSDKQAGKRTLVVRIGKNKGKAIYNTVSILTYLVIVVGIFLNYKYYVFGIISVVGLLLFYKATKIISQNINGIEELLPANALTVQNHLLTNILLLAGFIATKLLIL